MPRGLPKKYIKQYGITKKAWQEYRKAQGTTRTSRASGGKRKMPRRRSSRKKTRSKPRSPTIPLPLIAGVAVGVAGPAQQMLKGDIEGGLKQLAANYTGYTPGGGFSFNALKVGLMPLLAGFLVHWFAVKLGVNRALGRAGLPFIRM